jgi:hypothetical protein
LRAGRPELCQQPFEFVFDLGELEFVVSQHVAGGGDAHQRMLSYHGAGLVGPQSAKYKPSAEFVAWHRDQVFKEPGREST